MQNAMVHGQIILRTGHSDLRLQTSPKQVAFGKATPWFLIYSAVVEILDTQIREFTLW